MLMNFTMADLLATAGALAIFGLVLVPPGYLIGFLFDLLSFRRLSLIARLSLAVPLSIGICPLVSYLLWRFLSPVGIAIFYGACLIGFALLTISERKPWNELRQSLTKYRIVCFSICAVWVVIALFSLVDLQLGTRLYFPTVTYDYALRSAVTAAINRTGVPPSNPYFFPGQPFLLRYHYFWFMLCGIIQKAGGTSVSCRQAMIAGTVWCGIGLLAMVPLYLRFFGAKGAERLARRTLIGGALLAVTGLDIFPVLLVESKLHSQLASIEWWNDPVTAWVHTVLWVPHNIVSLIACLTGFLLLWNVAGQQRLKSRTPAVVLAGIMFASACGTAIYVCIAFGFFLAVWMVVAFLTKRRTHAWLVLSSGLVALPLAIPYLLELFPHQAVPAGVSAPLQFAVRPFGLVDTLFQIGHSGWKANLTHLILLPLNYLLEFGFFLAAGVFMVRDVWRNRRTLTDDRLCLFVMTVSIVLLCSFVRSSVIANNDLGWRGMLVAQFALLLCGVDFIEEGFLSKPFTSNARMAVAVMLFAGVAGSFYEVFKIRFYPLVSDVTTTALNPWLSKDRALGERTFQLRELYEELRRRTPESAVFQNNPNTNPQDLFHGMYADRQVAAETMSCAAAFGGDPALCGDRINRIDDMFETPGAVPAGEIDSLCDRFSINVLIVKDTDRVWRDRDSWAWRRKPVIANGYGRAFYCGALAAGWKGIP